jgi:mannose-6-phosphate isomerase-like protein (cupin superfamily)
MRFHRFDEHDEVEPAGHAGFTSRRLVNSTNGGDGSVSVTHASIAPGGTSTLHVHDHSVQIYVGLAGSVAVGDGHAEHELMELDVVVFEAGSPHFIENRTDETARALVITAPELKRG